MRAFLVRADEGPVVMLNLIQLKPDGGLESYQKYMAAGRCCMNRLDTRPLRLPSGRERLGPRLPELEHPVENPASDHRLPSLSLEELRP